MKHLTNSQKVMFQICSSLSLSLKTDPINVTLLLKYIIVLSACVDWNLIQIAQNRQAETIFCYFDITGFLSGNKNTKKQHQITIL